MRTLLALAVLATSSAAWAQSRRVALVVGANEGDPSEGMLSYAESDAQRMGEVLRAFGGVHEEDLVVLRGPTRQRVLDVLATLSRRVGADRPELLVFYYSGHADVEAMHLRGDHLGFDELRAALQALDVDLRLVVVDACRSGGLTNVKGASPAESFVIQLDDRTAAEGVAMLTSAAAGEDAQESQRLAGGVFTHHLVAGLRGAADVSGDLQVSLMEAYQYSYDRTLQSTSEQRFVQHPTFSYEVKGKSDIVLTSLADARDAARLTLPRAGTYLLFTDDRRSRLVLEATVPSGAQLLLPAGGYLVRQRFRDHVEQVVVRLAAGESAEISAASLQVVPYGRTTRKGLAERKVTTGISVAVGVEGPPLPRLSAGPTTAVGVRLDLLPLTLDLRLRHGLHVRLVDPDTEVGITHQSLGVDLGLYKLFDVERFAPGIGLRVGGDATLQHFTTAGDAPSRTALTGRVSPVARLEYAATARTALSVEAETTAWLYPDEACAGGDCWGTLGSRVVPGASLGVIVAF